MADASWAFITRARECAESGKYNLAFDHYIAAFTTNSSLTQTNDAEFTALVRQLTSILEEREQIDEVIDIYSRAMDVMHGNVYIINDIGALLQRYGFFMEAWDQFQRALSLDASFVSAEIHLNLIKSTLLERWHFRMLNDKKRNFAFRDAIKEIITPGRDSILDLGAGCGLFMMYAAPFMPLANVGIEASTSLFHLAESILSDNDFRSVSLVHKHSVDATPADIGGKKNFLITEVFDAGLFGEGVIKSLDHAVHVLLVENPKILPKKAEFFVVAIQSDLLLRRYQLTAQIRHVLSLPATCKVDLMNRDEPYDCEDVHLFSDVQYMTQSKSLLKVDFTNPEEIKYMLSNDIQYSLKMKALKKGVVTCIAGWFNLHLTDEITLTTDPQSEDRSPAWQQAIFFNFVPQRVQENEEFTLNFHLTLGDKLRLLPDHNGDILSISQAALKFLNDQEYMKMIINCVGIAFVYLGQLSHNSQLKICDLCPFPLFGMMLMKRGAGLLVCQAKTKEDKLFFETVFEANGIDDGKYLILPGDKWDRELLGNDKYHAIFNHIFDSNGNIDTVQMEIETYLKRNHLAEGGLTLPYNVTIMGQLIESPSLNINNRVHDENTGFKIAHQINKFQTSANYCIDFAYFDYKPLAESLVLGSCLLQLRSDVYNFPVLYDGTANAILCWYTIELIENYGYISTQRPNSFSYGVAYLADPEVPVSHMDVANILCCVDGDGAFKLLIDVEVPNSKQKT